jgi:hypothetical protein
VHESNDRDPAPGLDNNVVRDSVVTGERSDLDSIAAERRIQIARIAPRDAARPKGEDYGEYSSKAGMETHYVPSFGRPLSAVVRRDGKAEADIRFDRRVPGVVSGSTT